MKIKKFKIILFIISVLLFLLSFYTYSKSIDLSLISACLAIIIQFITITDILIENQPKFRMFYFTVFVVVSAPFATYSLLIVAKLLENFILPLGLSGDWISFTGSIIGGAMTLFGVIFTLQHETERNREEKAEQERRRLEELKRTYQPILKCEINDEVKSRTGFTDRFHFKLRNITDNHARNVKLLSCNIDWCIDSIDTHGISSNSIMNENQFIYESNLVSLLPGKEEYEFSMWIHSSGSVEQYEFVRKSEITPYLTLEFEFEDILGLKKNSYEYKLMFVQALDPHGTTLQSGHPCTVLKYQKEINNY